MIHIVPITDLQGRYGFYEGHTDHRADPVAIANPFGLADLGKIDAAVGRDLYAVLTQHY